MILYSEHRWDNQGNGHPSYKALPEAEDIEEFPNWSLVSELCNNKIPFTNNKNSWWCNKKPGHTGPHACISSKSAPKLLAIWYTGSEQI